MMPLKKRLQAAFYGLEVLTTYRDRATLARIDDRLVVSTDTESGPLYVHLLDHGVSRPLYTGQGFEKPEVDVLREHLRPGMTVIDIGANIGFMTCLIAQLVGQDGRVVSIEPEPGNLSLLRANIRRQGIDGRVEVFPCAAGAASGTVTLTRSAWNFGDHRVGAIGPDTVTVDVRTIDELVQHRPRVDFIKMDVQGYEASVVAGMRNTLATHRPAILCEYWPYGLRAAGADPRQYLNQWREAGYGWLVIGEDTAAESVPEHEHAFVNLLMTPEVNK